MFDEPVNIFNDVQLQPFTSYQLQFFCNQILNEEELDHEIQTTRDILIRLEMFEYDGKRVLAKDKNMLVRKYTQLFRTLLVVKAKCQTDDLYA